MDGDNLLKWMIEASTLGFKVWPWPDTFDYDGFTWEKDRMVVAESGVVQFVEYTAKDTNGEKWLVVYNA